MKNYPAYLLIFHGSRNQQYSQAIADLGNLVQKQLDSSPPWLKQTKLADECLPQLKATTFTQAPKETANQTSLSNVTLTSLVSKPLVEVAVLEFGEMSLSQSIVCFAHKAIANNYAKIKIVPVFLTAGVHVQEDIPREIARAKQRVDHKIELELLNYVGNYPQIANLIKEKFAFSTSGKILLAHGSRLSDGNVAVEHLAKQVNAINAYWTIQPDLSSVVELLVKQNFSSITIVPYFLFVGKITQEIRNQVIKLQNKFPQTKIFLTQPLGATTELAQMIISN